MVYDFMVQRNMDLGLGPWLKNIKLTCYGLWFSKIIDLDLELIRKYHHFFSSNSMTMSSSSDLIS